MSQKQLTQERLAQINSQAQKPTFVWPLRILAIFAALIVVGNVGFWPGVTVLVLGLFSVGLVRQSIEKKRKIPLFYTHLGDRFGVAQGACEALSKADRFWYKITSQQIWDWKRNAGANQLVGRGRAQVKRLDPPYISVNAIIWGINAGDTKVMFFPDAVLIYQARRYEAVSYELLGVTYSTTRFVEESPPKDADIIGYTWQYVRVDGGPDRRFSNNRQIPLALYGLLKITSPSGVNAQIQVSNRALAMQFAEKLATGKQREEAGGESSGGKHRTDSNRRSSGNQRRAGNSRSTGGQREAPRNPKHTDGSPAHQILGLRANASQDEIATAYRKMARMYHPDKVSHLAPEFQVLAERRMKEINAAYAELRRKAP